MSTGKIPRELGILGAGNYLVKNHGLGGLFAGAQARMVWSGAFSAVGFGTFELVKKAMGIESEVVNYRREVERERDCELEREKEETC